jgi:hypothetical protein
LLVEKYFRTQVKAEKRGDCVFLAKETGIHRLSFLLYIAPCTVGIFPENNP